MTNQEIRIAIAEACGWKAIKIGPGFAKTITGIHAAYKGNQEKYRESVPWYDSDLNAMAEAEMHIIQAGSTYTHYVSELQRLTEHNEWRATASQRAEAFLRTIGKWKD
jgi:hypothetical protein